MEKLSINWEKVKSKTRIKWSRSQILLPLSRPISQRMISNWLEKALLMLLINKWQTFQSKSIHLPSQTPSNNKRENQPKSSKTCSTTCRSKLWAKQKKINLKLVLYPTTRVKMESQQINISKKMKTISHKSMQNTPISRRETETTWTSPMKLIPL